MNNNEELKNIGYSILGPFIVAYCKWLHEQKEILSLNGIIFLSRDGFLIKSIYEILFPEDKNIYYIRVSRKALRLPFIAVCKSYDEFLKTIPPFRNYSVKDFVNAICDVNEIILPTDIDVNYTVSTLELQSDNVLKKTYEFVRKEIAEKAEKQCKYLNQYINQHGIFGKIGLVDHSYKATSQYLLEKIIDMPGVSFWGLYFYTNEIADLRISGNMSSFMDSIISKRNSIVFEKGILTERLLFETCGTTLCYEKKASGIVPVLATYFQQDDEDIIKYVQDGARLFAQHYYENKESCDSNLAVRNMLRLLKWPSKRQAKVLGKLKDDDIKTKASYLACIKENDNFVGRIKGVKKSIWRQGYLMQLPMGKVLCWIYNLIFDIFQHYSKFTERIYLK